MPCEVLENTHQTGAVHVKIRVTPETCTPHEHGYHILSEMGLCGVQTAPEATEQCRTCRKHVHKSCMQTWLKSTKHWVTELLCVLCRSLWTGEETGAQHSALSKLLAFVSTHSAITIEVLRYTMYLSTFTCAETL